MDDTGTIATEDRLKAAQANGETTVPNEIDIAAVPINENLFVDDDLDGIDDELNDLDLDQEFDE